MLKKWIGLAYGPSQSTSWNLYVVTRQGCTVTPSSPTPPDEIVQGVPSFLPSLPVHPTHKAFAPRVLLAGVKLKALRERGRSIYKSWWLCLGPPPPRPCVSRLHSLVFHPWVAEQAVIETSQTCWSFQSEWCPWVSLSFFLLLKVEQDPFALAKISIRSRCGKLWIKAYVSHLNSGNHLNLFLLLQVTSIMTSRMVRVRPATVTQWEQLDKCVLQTQASVCALIRP